MAGFWIWKYAVEDRDIGVVDYVMFEKSLDIDIPSATFCFPKPFLKKHMNSSSYERYLAGNFKSEAYKDVAYDNVTIDLQKYFLYVKVKLRNSSIFEDGTVRHTTNFNGFTVLGFFGFFKCFEVTLDMPYYRNVEEILLNYDFTSLVNDTYSEVSMFLVSFHYNGQFLLALEAFQTELDKYAYNYNFQITDIELIRGRNSRKRSCTPYNDIVPFDEMVREKHVISAGCAAPYLHPINDLPKCITKEAIRRSSYHYSSVRTIFDT